MHDPQEGTVQYFGPGSQLVKNSIETPTDEHCIFCDEPIIEGECGVMMPAHGLEGKPFVAYHKECILRMVTGSVAHQKGECKCFGGEGEDDPTLSKREAAKAAARLFTERVHAINVPYQNN